MTELTSTTVVPAPVEVVGRVVSDVAHWAEWVPGLAECGQPSPGEVRGVWSGPVAVGFHFCLKEAEGSLICEMVESDVPFAEVCVSWWPCDEGASVTVRLTLQLGRTLPGSLWRELESAGLPALLRGLSSRAARLRGEG